MQSVIAIVGRPNVGKSALFNRLAGRRIAIVHDQPGVTRDRVMTEAEWQGHPFTLIDTGGIGLLRGERADDVITAAAFDQVQMALEAASVILFVVNVQDGVVPLDLEVAKRLRAANRPVVVVVNKVDHDRADSGLAEFSALGFDTMLPISAIHSRGIADLMEHVTGLLPASAASTSAEGVEEAPKSTEPKPLRLAVVGRPNVGKSSIINALTGSQRVIVSPIAGTTRDAVDVPLEVTTEGRRENFILVDTAGLRKARRVDDAVEHFSTERTRDAISKSDIVILVVDAGSGILEQHKKIADLITEAHRACIIVVNKWDTVAEAVRAAQEEEYQRRKQEDTFGRPKRLVTLGEFGNWVHEKLFFLDYAPVIFTSAKDGFQLERLLDAVRYVSSQWRQKIPTSILNRTLADSIEKRQPVSKLGHRLNFFYATQIQEAPPSFLLFVNRKEVFSPPYEKYLAGELRKVFGFEGCPLVLMPRGRPKTIEPVRKHRPLASKGRSAARPDRNIDRGAKRGRGPGRPKRAPKR